MRKRNAHTAKDDDDLTHDEPEILDETEQDSLAKALLAEALVAQKGYRIAAFVLLGSAILLPQAQLPTLLALLLRLSLLLTIVRLGHGLWTTGVIPPPHATDLVLVVTPALTGASALLSVTSAAASRSSPLLRALPLLLQLASVWAAQQGESLVRDARGLEDLKYSAPGA